MNKYYLEKSHSSINDLIQENLNLVKKIAWQLHGRVQNIVEIEDLIQQGMEGLVHAAQKYSPREGVNFAQYAQLRIRGSIIDYLRKNSNLCRTTISNKQKYEKCMEELRKKLDREPTETETCETLEIDLKELHNWKEAFAANKLEDIDSVYDEFSIWFESKEDTPEENMTDIELRDELIKSLKKLEKTEALVIQLYYVEELNVFEIAKILDLTNGRISQIKSNAIKRLRNDIKNVF